MSDLESSLSRALGERRDSAVIQTAAAVEHCALDAGLLRPIGDQLSDRLGPRGLAFVGDLDVGRMRDRRGRTIVDQLCVDVAVRAIHCQPRPRRVAGDLLPDATVTPHPGFPLRLGIHQAAPVFAALPAFFRTYSPSYRMPLPLYGSGLRTFRMFAAISPTCCLSLPRTTIWVGVGTSNSMPFGCGTTTGCE